MPASRRVVLGSVLGSALGWSVGVRAQPGAYPERPITLIVPFPPGGVDSLVRLVGDKAAAILGQPFVYRNQPGAGGRIGTEALARAPNDGYTIGVATVSGLVTIPALAASPPYDPVADFSHLVMVLEGPYLIVAYPGSGLRSVPQLVERAKAEPGRLRIGSTGVGSGTHLVIERLMAAAGVQLVHVPYKGEAPLVADLAGGQLELAVTNTASMPLIDAGKLLLLAVASNKRVASLPDTPTIVEAGLDVVTAGWLGFAAPAGITAAVRDKLLDAFVRAARDPEVRSALKRAGTEPVDLAGEAFSAVVRREFDRLRELNKTLKLVVQ
jgi:tripartite-type tricarboxylate transporter receptor subunit TctC